MSIWPFANRAPAKPKRGAPQPSPSQATQPGAGEKKNPVHAGEGARGVSRRLSRKASRRRSGVRSPSRQLQPRKSNTAPPALNALNESANISEKPKEREPAEEEKENSAPAPPLEPVEPSSPMDVDFAQRRPSTGGSMRAEKITALPNSRTLATSPHLRPVTQEKADIPYNWNLRTHPSHHSLPPQTSGSQRRSNKLQRNPSRNKRAAPSSQYDSPLARRRSSKKRKNDPVREEEIRAMSRPIDVPRKNADTGILRRESKKSRGPLNRNLERPTSTISLPFEESIHSSMSGDAEPRRFRLSVLDVISPRPAMRYRDMGKTHTNDTASSQLIRKVSRSEKPSGKPVQTWRPTKEEKEARDRARVDSLADDMDSTELRDILERDRKRKVKKQERDAERLQRKLERRAEKQRTKEWLAQQETVGGAETTTRPSPAGELGIKAAAHGKDVDAHMAEEPDFHMEDVQPSDPFVDTPQTARDPFQDPERAPSIPAEAILDIHPAHRTPKQQEKVKDVFGEPEVVVPPMPGFTGDEEEIRRDVATPMSEIRTPLESPAIDTAQAVSYTAARPITPISPVTSALYHGDRTKASKVLGADVAGGSYTKTNTILDEATRPAEADSTPLAIPERKETAKKEPEVPLSASKKKSGFLASLFRGRRASQSEAPREAPTPEPSFSNTSREEMSRNIPAHLVHQPSSATSFRKAGPPLRTQSIFREDLPESPLSPPDSRVQSPVEPSTLHARYARRQKANIPSAIMSEGSGRVASPENDSSRPGSPLSGKASNIMSHSLASVDSEASWLSGGRNRSVSNVKRHTGGSFGRKPEFDGSYEELGMPDDEYFRRLNTGSRGNAGPSGLAVAIAGSQHASSTALRSPTLPPQAEEGASKGEGQLISHAGASRQPTVVHRADTRHKSSEGLLNTFQSQATTAGASSDDHDTTPEGEYPTPADTPTEERSSEEMMTPVQRATSVNLGQRGHVRNISAGSAKLLDIPRRSSRGDVVDMMSVGGTPNPPATPVRSQTNIVEEKKEDDA